MHHLHVSPRAEGSGDARRQLVGDRHAAVLAAGAADREGDEPLALPFIAGNHYMQQLSVVAEELP